MTRFLNFRRWLGLPIQIGLVEQVSAAVSFNNGHLVNQRLDAISERIVGERISFSYLVKDYRSSFSDYRVYRVFQQHGFPYVAFDDSAPEYFVKRLDRMTEIVSIDTGQVFGGWEEWLEAAGVKFARRFERSPKSQPFV